MAQEVRPKVILVYEDEHGHEPYTDWVKSLRDAQGKARIEARLRRLATTGLAVWGLCTSREGVKELRMFLVRDTGSILVKRLIISWFCSAVVTKALRIRILR